MAQGLVPRDRAQVRWVIEKRPARRGQDKPCDGTQGFACQALPYCGVLRIDRPQPGKRTGQWIGRPRRGDEGGALACQRHDQVATGDERFLVGRGDDLSGKKSCQHRFEADDSAAGDQHEIDVGSSDQPLQAVRPRRRACAGREVEPPRTRWIAWQRDHDRPQPPRLLLEETCLAAGCEGHHLNRPAEASEDLDRLASNRTAGSNERDAERLVRRRGEGHRRNVRTYSVRTGAANRNESTRSRMPPCPGIRLLESLAPAARLRTDSARSPA